MKCERPFELVHALPSLTKQMGFSSVTWTRQNPVAFQKGSR